MDILIFELYHISSIDDTRIWKQQWPTTPLSLSVYGHLREVQRTLRRLTKCRGAALPLYCPAREP